MRLLPFAVFISLGLLMTGCDAVVYYTIDNRTDQHLLTWGLLEDCSHEIGNGDEYLDTHGVTPRSEVLYEEIYSGSPKLRCVQVATADRHLILSEPFHEGTVYTVEEPITPGILVPDPNDLPERSFSENWRENWLSNLVILIPIVLILAAVAYGVFRVIIGTVHGVRSGR